MKYKIIGDLDYKELEQAVEGFVRTGWRPQGGVSAVVYPSGHVSYIQAIVMGKENA